MDRSQDVPFETMLQQLKPFVLRLQDNEKHRIKLWLKKLNEVNINDAGSRRSRLMYLNLLKMMLEKGDLESPFNAPPSAGPLPPLPSYLTMFFDVPTGNSSLDAGGYHDDQYRGKRKIQYSASKKRTSASLPDLTAVLPSTDDESDDDFASIMRNVHSATSQRRPATPSSFGISKMYTSTPGPIRAGGAGSGSPLPSNNIPVQLPIGQPVVATSHTMPNYKAIIEKEVQMKERLLSTRFNEEKMKIQRHHNELVQKIKDKSTKEVEQFRSEYRNKVMQLENNCKTLERRTQQLSEENARIRDQRDRQGHEYKNLQQQNLANLKLEYEKKLQRLEKTKTEEIARLIHDHEMTQQNLLDETSATMTRMEQEYKKHAETMGDFLKEQEEKHKKLREENEETMTAKRISEEKCKELEVELNTLNTQLKLSEEKIKTVEEDMSKMEKNLLDELEQHKLEAKKTAEITEQEYTYNLSHEHEVQSQLEEQLKQMKQIKTDEAVKYENKIWEVESQAKSDIAKTERACDKKLRNAEKAAEKRISELNDELAEMKKHIKMKDKEVKDLYEAQKLQNAKSERALQDLKKEMQGNTDRLYKDVQEQVLTLEADLEKEAFEREKIDVSYQQKLKEEKFLYEERLSELETQHEAEKRELIEKYHRDLVERESKNDLELKLLSEQKERELGQLESRYKQRSVEEMKMTQELEKKIEKLKMEVSDLKTVHAKELLQLETEKERERRDLEDATGKSSEKHRYEMDQLRRGHNQEIEMLTSKTNTRIKALQDEFEQKLELNAEALEKSKKISVNLEEEMQRQGQIYENSIKKLQQEIELIKVDEEARSRNIIKALEQEVDTQRNMIKHLEKRLKITDLETQEKLSRMRLTYEERLKGVVPHTVREELEETIAALKAQSVILEQKATLLQSELEARSIGTPARSKPSPYAKKHRSPYTVKAK